MNSYRSSYGNSYNGYPPPPPQAMQPPLPRAPPPSFDPYRDGDSYRPQPPQSDFSFRSDYAPQFPREQEHMRSTRSREYAMRENNSRAPPANNHRDNVNLNQARRGHGYRVRPNHRAIPADRPLLRHQDDDNSSEQMLGMANGQKFMSAEDVSDSDEEQMNESESDAGQSGSSKADLIAVPTGVHETVGGTLESAAKRRALTSTSQQAKEGASQPKWSNPDPYTVLPPIDEARKRKDVVKLIRKARKEAEGVTPEQNQVAANDDFISFGMEEDKEVIPISPSVDEGESYGLGVPGAPLGPRPFSHLKNLHGQDAPGTLGQTVSANSLGPPPGLAQEPPPVVAENILLDTALTDANAAGNGGDAALGNRKRAYDDSIKGQKKGSARFTGSILREWIPPPSINATPWLRRTEMLTANAGFRLHKEICDFYNFVKPQKFEQTVREELLTRLQANVDKHLPNTRVVCFGSFAAGLYLPNADMDVVVVSSSFQSSGQKVACQSKNQMWRFANFIETSRLAMAHSVEVVPGAKVPIIKFVDRITNLKVDVSFENDTGIIANETFARWKRQFPVMPVLVTVIKQFLMMRGLNEVQHGGLGGFSVTCLVTSLLQNMPRVQSGELIPEQHLGEMLIEFLDFYGNRLDTRRTGIMMLPHGYFGKELIRPKKNGATYQADKADRLAIIDPNKPSNDISGGSREVMLIFDRFAQAHNEILQAMKSPGRISLLDWSLGGNYESFIWQRNHLLALYQERWGASVDILDQFQPPESSNGTSPELVERRVTLTDRHKAPVNNGSGGTFIGSTGKKSHIKTAGESGQRQHDGSAQGIGPQSEQGEGNHKGKGRATNRAASFKARYPEMKGIGSKLSKKKMQKLEADQAARARQPTQHTHLTQPIQSPHSARAQAVPPAELSKGQKRAAELRAKYPDIGTIPNTIGAKQKKTLIEQYRLQNAAQRTSNPMHPAPTNSSFPTRQPSRSHQNLDRFRPLSNKMAPLSDERRAEVARNLGGTSNDNPINLD